MPPRYLYVGGLKPQHFDDALEGFAQMLVAFVAEVFGQGLFKVRPVILDGLAHGVTLLGQAGAGLHFGADGEAQEQVAVFEAGQPCIELVLCKPGKFDKRLGGGSRRIGKAEEDRIVTCFQPARGQRGEQGLPGQMARFDEAVKSRAGGRFGHGY